MYIPDLAPYYSQMEYNAAGTRAVGWLAVGYEFKQGGTSPCFREALYRFCSHPVRRMRGFHQCDFCAQSVQGMCHEDGLWLGAAEIRVFYKGNVYASPDLIYHYVIRHRYCPPDEFIEAVLRGPRPGSDEYDQLLRELPEIW